MFKWAADLLAFVLTVQQRAEANQRQTDKLSHRVDAQDERVEALAFGLQELRAEFRAFVQHQQDEREKQELRFQLALERLERRLALPPSASAPELP